MKSSSSRTASNIETSQLSMTPDEAWANILPFIDMPISPRVYQSFHQHYTAYMEAQYLPWNPIAHLYRQLIFSKGDNILPPTSESIQQPLYFRPDVNIRLNEIEQPEEIRIHAFTTSNSMDVDLNQVSSIIIEPSTSSHTSGYFDYSTLPFLERLFTKSYLGNLKNFKLTGFTMNADNLWSCLSRLDLDWVHYTPPHAMGSFVFYDYPKPYRLHMNLREGFDLFYFPRLPYLLKELSLHISNPCNHENVVDIDHCRNLEKMYVFKAYLLPA